MTDKIHIEVKGKLVDDTTRCIHYHSPLDIIALRMKCCNEYYACIQCHQEETTHPALVWGADEFDTKAVLCGACNTEMSITTYLNSNNQCPFCKSNFNPLCSNHYPLYFDMD